MINLRKFALTLPFAFAVAACSSNRSSSDTGTAAGTLSNDTAAVRSDTNPVPGAMPGNAIDTSKKAMPMDSMTKDSAARDSLKRESKRHHSSKKAKKPY
jgi:hypothetical protein